MELSSETLDPRPKKSFLTVAQINSRSPSDDGSSSHRSIESYGLLDLYSSEAFLTVLQTPRIYDSFAAFLQSEHSSENLVFWSRCERYKCLQKELLESLTEMEVEHMQDSSSKEINVSQKGRLDCLARSDCLKAAMACAQTDFEKLQKEVELLMWRDSYPRFLKHHLAYNARKSLQWYPGKTFTFKGLGQCFCITDPRYRHLFIC
jgi:hypothetical protein